MIKLRTLAVVILVAAVLAVGGVPLTAEAAPVPMLCFCTVYECEVAVGAGYTVTAYIEATTGATVRDSGLTDANGDVTLQIWATDPELLAGEAVTFKVNGVPAATTPDPIAATLAPTYPSLDICDVDVPPQVTTNAAGGVTHYSATLNGNLDDMGDYASVDVYFEYGTTTSYGSTTSAVTKYVTGAFSAYISGLSPETLYHFRAAGGYDSEDVYGIDRTFTTLEGPAWPFTRTLCAGWNIVSTPVTLESTGNANKFGQIVPAADVLAAYRFYSGYWYPVTSYTVLLPLVGWYVNVDTGGTTATFVPEDGITAPPKRTLYTGWNLVGPAPGYEGGFPDTPVMENLMCMMTGGYFDGAFSFSNVVSPPLCQDGWTFNPWYSGSEPDMVPFKGYFVYMESYDTLVGYSTTPLAP